MHLFFERIKREGLAMAVKQLARTEKYEKKNEIVDSSSGKGPRDPLKTKVKKLDFIS